MMPPLPTHPDVHTFRWTMSELDAIEAYGKACHQAALDEVLAKIEAMRNEVQNQPKRHL